MFLNMKSMIFIYYNKLCYDIKSKCMLSDGFRGNNFFLINFKFLYSLIIKIKIPFVILEKKRFLLSNYFKFFEYKLIF